MKWTAFIILTVLYLTLVGCGAEQADGQFAGYEPVAAFTAPTGEALELTIDDLVSAPDAYTGELVRVTGNYYRAPVVVCDGSVRRSPVTWRLRSGEEEIGVRGFESLLQPLWPAGLNVTVEGVWQQWRGPIGCGKQATLQQVWYLNTSEIIAPNPIVRVTLTPTGNQVVEITPLATLPGAEGEGEQPTPGGGPPPVGTPVTMISPTPTSNTSTATVAPTNTPTPIGPLATSTPTISPSPTTETDTTATVTVTPDGTTTPQTPVATATEGTPGATPPITGTVTTTPTPGPTATDLPLNISDQGNINFQDLQGRQIQGGQAHRWQFPAGDGDTITILVAPPPDQDIAFSLVDPAGNNLLLQDENGAGEIETLSSYVVDDAGSYQLIIREANGDDISYLMMVLNDVAGDDNDDFYSFNFADNLEYGETRNGSLAEETDEFWFFQGTAGDRVTITVTPTNDSDILFEIYGPTGDRLVDFVDSRGATEAEEYDFQVSTNGLYAIRVGEAAYEQSDYTISVTED